MTVRIFASIILLLAFWSAAIACGFYSIQMIGAVNLKKKESEKISWIGNYPGKLWWILGEYRKLYPDDNMHVYLWSAYAVMLICLIGLAVDWGTTR